MNNLVISRWQSRSRRASLCIATAALAACSSAPRANVVNQGSRPLLTDSVYDVVILNGKVVDGSGNPWFYGDGRDVSKLTQGVTTEILGKGCTSAPISDLTLADLSASGAAAVASARRFQRVHGFDAWLRAMEAHGLSPNISACVAGLGWV